MTFFGIIVFILVLLTALAVFKSEAKEVGLAGLIIEIILIFVVVGIFHL